MTADSDGLGIGSADPSFSLDIGNTDGVRLARGTTSQRPTLAAGVVRWNITTSRMEYCDGTVWHSLLTDQNSTLDGLLKALDGLTVPANSKKVAV